MRLAIADPPYPPQFSERYDRGDGAARVVWRSRARRWYGTTSASEEHRKADFHPAAGEWDDPARHRRLLEELLDTYDGWAIATTLDGLECYRPLPIPARLLIWHKRRPMPTGHRIATTLEAVIAYPPKGRRRREDAPQLPDLLVATPPGAGFAGAKPEAWTRWVLDALGYREGDDVTDLFPGSGAIAAALTQGVLL